VLRDPDQNSQFYLDENPTFWHRKYKAHKMRILTHFTQHLFQSVLLALAWHMRLITRFSPQRTALDTRSYSVVFMVDKVTPGPVNLWLPRLSPVTIIPPIHHMLSSQRLIVAVPEVGPVNLSLPRLSPVTIIPSILHMLSSQRLIVAAPEVPII
jgi:hypothetical protein